MKSNFEVVFLEQALAFLDKTDNTETLVLASHGFIKKVDKVPKKEIEKAKIIRKQYFEQK